MATEQVTQTTLRSLISGTDLDEVGHDLDSINEDLRNATEELTGRWGVKLLKIETGTIRPMP